MVSRIFPRSRASIRNALSRKLSGLTRPHIQKRPRSRRALTRPFAFVMLDHMRSAVIQAFEHYLPSGRVTNDDLAAIYPGWTAEKILEKTGIRSRAVVAPGETASDLAVCAVEKLLSRTGLNRSRVDLFVYCTQSPDYFLPTTACLLQDRLGLPTSVAAFDYNLGCSAFPYGLAIVRGLIDAGLGSTALLVMGE